ncbi:MAG TPA: TonB-dependent receptor [Steroidobacter sp.]|uniref:TonB-dependent receptor n=1 Tax=Steroidobacter sp. TaxID=1978227 RepID=UPI002ED88E21
MHTRYGASGLLCALVFAQASGQALPQVNDPIPAQPIASALTAFSRQTGLQIVYVSRVADQVQSAAIPGGLSAQEALRRLLDTTGLTFEFLDQRTVTIVVEKKRDSTVPATRTTSLREDDSRYIRLVQAEPASSARSESSAKASLPAERSGEARPLEEVVVSGIRGSLRESLDSKREATAIVDVINSEDIGKFPDKNVADSLQRIPGISVDRIWGEGRDIFVRGTDSTMNRTLMNGQSVASAYWWANDNPSRGFNYDILASELVAALEVYKSPEADIDEGSIGGLVNVRTRRPMDLAPFTARVSAEAQYSDLPDEVDPQVSGLLSWQNDAGTFGALGSVSYQTRNMRRDGLEAFPDNTLFDITDQNGNVTRDVYSVWGGGSAIFQQDRERITANATLQFRPDDRWDIALNYVNSDMDMDNHNQNYLFMPGGYKLPAGATVTNPVFIPTSDGRQALVGGRLDDPNTPGASIEPIYREAFIESQVIDLDVSFKGDGWRLHGQSGYTNAEGGSDRDQNYWFQGNTREVINLGPNTIEVAYPDLDATDAAALTLVPANLRDWVRKMEEEEFYAQGDLQVDIDSGFFKSFKTGVKFRDDTVENNRQVGTVDPDNPNYAALSAITMDQVSTGLTPALHGEAATSGSLTRYAWINGDLARQVIDPLLDLQYDFDERAYYKINEQIVAAYVKGDFELGRLRGNAGVRAVRTDQDSTAFINGARGTVSRSYTDYLPSVNAVFGITNDLLLRGAVSRAMARNTFQDLSANITIDATTGSASAGNPQLDPIYADQFELGAEWYFSDASLVSATYFWKSLDTFIYRRTASEAIDGQTLNVTRPFNSDDGADIQGVELQWQQSFGGGFGAVLNYTFTDAEVDPVPGQPKLQLQGNSEDQLNASAYFENDRFSVRLSYNYRSDAFGALTMGSQIVTDAYEQLDATASWNWSDAVVLYATAVNITNEVIYQRTDDGIPVGFYENGPRYSLGARVRF